MPITVMVSACLLGLPTDFRASGKNRLDYLSPLSERVTFVPFCPEQLGGLPTPRLPSEIEAGCAAGVWRGERRVLRSDGADVTEAFKKGAETALSIARMVNPDLIIMKERSPSCGVTTVYDGTFSDNAIAGPGMSTVLLQEHGYTLCSEEELPGRLAVLIKE